MIATYLCLELVECGSYSNDSLSDSHRTTHIIPLLLNGMTNFTIFTQHVNGTKLRNWGPITYYTAGV